MRNVSGFIATRSDRMEYFGFVFWSKMWEDRSHGDDAFF